MYTELNPVFRTLIWVAALMFCVSVNAKAASEASGDNTQKIETFVQQVGDQVIRLLSNKAVGRTQREQAFLGILEKDFAIHSIGKFVLGKHWRHMSKDQKDTYLQYFKKSIARTYAIRFEAYENETFEVLKGKTVAPTAGKKNWKVYCHIKKPGKPATEIAWLVVDTPKGPKGMDVFVENVSMSITQRSEYAGIIENGGGGKSGIEALLKRLQSGS